MAESQIIESVGMKNRICIIIFYGSAFNHFVTVRKLIIPFLREIHFEKKRNNKKQRKKLNEEDMENNVFNI